MITGSELGSLTLFEGTSARALSVLAARAREVRFPSGRVLFLAGSQPRGWFVVIEGRIRVVRGSAARQHVVHSEGPGGTLGEVPLVTGGTHPATGIAAEPTRCALFDRRSLEAAIAECPEIAFVLTRRLALRVRDLVARLDQRSSRGVQARLSAFLLARPRSARHCDVSVGMTQQQLAEELGTVREVISRELRRLSRAQLITPLRGGRYRLLDLPGLRQAAEVTL